MTIVCGYRGQEAQQEAFMEGKSELNWPDSAHNNELGNEPYSLAIDIAPYNAEIPGGIDWNDISEFCMMAAYVKQAAIDLGIEIEWGGDWNSFKDYPHFQLIL